MYNVSNEPIVFNIIFQYVQNNKAADNDWFRLESNKEGTKWFGKCWVFQNQLKYEFDIEFDVSCFYNSILFFIFTTMLLTGCLL